MSMTIQSNIKRHNTNLEEYSLWMGGLNAKNGALKQYDPLKTGYARIFFLNMPKFMDTLDQTMTKKFRHIMEFGFIGVDGLQNLTMDFAQLTGGYTGASLDVATVLKDETNEITLKVHEFSGSPVREYLTTWMTGISDRLSGLAHYHGVADVPYAQYNHTAEAIYLQTDPTGRSSNIEYACLLTNMMPKTAKVDHFNYTAGQHDIVEVDIPFTVVKYESPQINAVAKALLDKFQILRNYLNFHSGYEPATIGGRTAPVITDWQNAYYNEAGNVTADTPK